MIDQEYDSLFLSPDEEIDLTEKPKIEEPVTAPDSI